MLSVAKLRLPISWAPDGTISGRENLTPEQNAALDAAIAAYDPIKEAANKLASEIRAKRNTLIAETDYMFTSDYPLSEDQKIKYSKYRQALRDITLQAAFPQNVDWPVLE